MSQLTKKLAALGLELPPAPPPAANYEPAAGGDTQLAISGQLPLLPDGTLLARGKVGVEVDLETARDCARQCALNALAVLNQHLRGDFRGGLNRLLRVGVYVASDPGFTDQHRVADGASDLLREVLGSAGRHARAAVGCVSLPRDAPVEVELTVLLRGDLFASD
jgi:enamine deaminase RidA (YjgF/YER057c/UK114 family)